MHHNVTIQALDSRILLRPEATAEMPAAVSAALLALEASRPGTLDDPTPATTIAEAIEAIGWSASWDGGESADVTTDYWLRVPLAGLLAWADAMQPFVAPGTFILLAIGDGTSALLLDEGHDDRPLAGTELEALQAALAALKRHGAICGRPPAWDFNRAARSIARIRTPLRAAERTELYTCIEAWDRAWQSSILLSGGMFHWPLEWRWCGDLSLLLAELRAAGLLVRHNGRTGGSIWLVPHSAPGRLQALREERNEP
jgi:hypothetical protein